MLVREIFFTLQGEGPNAGTPAVFVRLAGCPLACHWCDTDFAEERSQAMDVHEILCSIKAAAHDAGARCPKLVVITGGEPLAQDIFSLTRALLCERYRVQVETSGVKDLLLFAQVQVVVSPKTPKVNYKGAIAGWKYIVRAGELAPDGLPYYRTQDAASISDTLLARPEDWEEAPIYVQPCDEKDPERNAANLRACLESVRKHGYRLSLQQHKIIDWP